MGRSICTMTSRSEKGGTEHERETLNHEGFSGLLLKASAPHREGEQDLSHTPQK